VGPALIAAGPGNLLGVTTLSTVRTADTALSPPPRRHHRVAAAFAQALTAAQAAIAPRIRVTGRRRVSFFMVGDAVAVLLATALACHFTPAAGIAPGARVLLLGAAAALLVLSANLLGRNYRLAWVTFSLSDLRRLFVACAAVTLLLAAIGRGGVLGPARPPDPLLWGMTLFFGLAAFRGSKRLLVEPFFQSAEGRRTLVVMSARYAYFLPSFLRRLTDFRYHIVGIIDPDPRQVGSYEQGIEVVGTTDDVEDIVERYRAEVVMVMLESNPGFGLGELYARLQRLDRVEVRTLPSLVDVIEDRSDIGALEKLSIHELTGRPPVAVDVNEMRRAFGGRSILVTGAGGSIGSELCRQLARFGPARLVLFERDDSNLFGIDREFRSGNSGPEVVPFLGDVTHQPDLDAAFGRYRPEFVFHAAAYKHVPILEFHAADAVRVNAVGTHLLARTAVRHGAGCLVYVSTDKAVNPTSAMGASKRLGEMVATSMNGLGDLRTVAVRFGNVLDSRGSVSTVFRDAIARRQPLTVTHRDMRRYFMLTSEAVLLVLQAAALGKGGEVFVLDMGEPVRIWDLAHRMVELSGLTPNVDIPVITGRTRPGEKLFEELLTAEEGTVATANDRIFRARISRNCCYPDLLPALDRLAAELERLENDAVKQRLARLVPHYRPDACTGLAPSAHLAVDRA